MIFFLKGIVQELTPTYAVLDVNGVGYYVGISLQTSNKLTLGKETFIFTQQIIREDAHLLFGFHTKEEKEMFNLLISVNGVGAVSALILLSSLDLKDIAQAILNKNSALLQKVKVDVILDDRDERAGVKFNDMDLIGVPVRITVGKTIENGQVEVKLRNEKDVQLVNIDEVLDFVNSKLND